MGRGPGVKGGRSRQRRGGRTNRRWWMRPPSLLSLAMDTAVSNISFISDLSAIPDPLLLPLFFKTLSAGKLNEKVLKLFMDTGSEEVLSRIHALKIQHIIIPVLPTRIIMAGVIKDEEVDIVIAAIQPNISAFMEKWRIFLSKFHLIIIKDPDLKEELVIPSGFDHDVYTKSDIDKIVGTAAATLCFSGYSCRYFGYLISRKKYVVAFDDDCLPAKDDKGNLVDPVAQHITNLCTPATPFFFNTLYDPFRAGADFVRGFPFSLRNGVECALSCGLWLNMADYDAPTQAVKPKERNHRYVDAVLTVPIGALLPVSGINFGFNRLVLGPVMVPGFQLSGEGKKRWETMEDIWCGMCAKVVCDHLGYGVKNGLPYVWRGKVDEGCEAMESLKQEWEGVKLMEDVAPFFQSVRLPRSAVTADQCVVEIAGYVKDRLGSLDPLFGKVADAMLEWVKLWKTAGVESV